MSRAIFRIALVAGLAVAAARSSFAAGPVGTAPFKLASCTNCTVSNPGLAGAPTGRLVGTFDVQPVGQTPTVQGRLFPVGGASRAPFRPQVALNPAQYDATVASNATGAFVIAWSTTDPGTHNNEIWAQRYDIAGVKKGATIAVSLDPVGVHALDARPVVAMAADGGFTVAWIRIVPPSEPNPTGFQVWARRYGPTGAALTAPTLVSATGLVDGTRPGACIDTAGRSVIVWSSDDEIKPFEPSLIGVSMRRLTPKGIPIAGVVVVAQPKSSESHPAVSCGPASTFVVAWETNQPPTAGLLNVVAQRFSATAARVGSVFLVSAASTFQRVPAIAHDAGGNFVVVWQVVFSSPAGIYGQRFSPTATKLGAPFTVALAESSVKPLTSPAIAVSGAANAFAVAWDDPKLGGFARRFKIVP